MNFTEQLQKIVIRLQNYFGRLLGLYTQKGSSEDKDLKSNNHIGWGFVLLIIVLVIFFASWLVIKKHYEGAVDFNTARGTFGDQFGAVNALFSALAFAGLIYTIILQMNELRYQRVELADNRKEMERQTTEFKQQNEALKRQSFEHTFFNMLSLQQQIVSELTITEQETVWLKADAPKGGFDSHQEIVEHTYKGREAFEFLFFHQTDRQANGLSQELIRGGLLGYENAYYRTRLDHYFRHFYTILKFVDGSSVINEGDKYQYATILRATLSRYELVLLYYNGLSSLGNKKLKPLLEKYCILNNLNPYLLILSHNGFEKTKAGTPEQAYQALQNLNFTGTDYELFMTDAENEPHMYNFKAFAHNQQEFDRLTSIKNRIDYFFKETPVA